MMFGILISLALVGLGVHELTNPSTGGTIQAYHSSEETEHTMLPDVTTPESPVWESIIDLLSRTRGPLETSNSKAPTTVYSPPFRPPHWPNGDQIGDCQRCLEGGGLSYHLTEFAYQEKALSGDCITRQRLREMNGTYRGHYSCDLEDCWRGYYSFEYQPHHFACYSDELKFLPQRLRVAHERRYREHLRTRGV